MRGFLFAHVVRYTLSMKIIIWILIIGAVVFGGYSLVHNKNSVVVKTEEQQVPIEKPEESTGKKMAFAQFVKQGGSYQCTVHQAVSDFDTEGTVFISKGNIRGEFKTIAEGKNVTSSILVRDGFMYAWSSMMPKSGMKMVVKADAQNNGASGSGTYSWNAEQIGEYDCTPWAPDESTFAVPTAITFTLIPS